MQHTMEHSLTIFKHQLYGDMRQLKPVYLLILNIK
jgi:hypothetical protein